MSPERLAATVATLREKADAYREQARNAAYVETRERAKGALEATIAAIELLTAEA